MAAHTWRLDAEIGLWHRYLEEARRMGDGLMVAHCAHHLEGLRIRLVEYQSQCEHVPNPEAKERCYRCGQGLATMLKGPVKASPRVVVLSRAASSSG